MPGKAAAAKQCRLPAEEVLAIIVQSPIENRSHQSRPCVSKGGSDAPTDKRSIHLPQKSLKYHFVR